MPEYLSISEIMQTAVTPVFLLAGIGALLNVMTGRLGRIIDRLRYLQSFLERINLEDKDCLLYTSPSPRDLSTSRMPSSA